MEGYVAPHVSEHGDVGMYVSFDRDPFLMSKKLRIRLKKIPFSCSTRDI